MSDWADGIAVDLVWKARNLQTQDCTKLLAAALRKSRQDALEEAAAAVYSKDDHDIIRALKDKQP